MRRIVKIPKGMKAKLFVVKIIAVIASVLLLIVQLTRNH